MEQRDTELVSEDGCISDESSFFGNDNVQHSCEQKARRKLDQSDLKSTSDSISKSIKLQLELKENKAQENGTLSGEAGKGLPAAITECAANSRASTLTAEEMRATDASQEISDLVHVTRHGDQPGAWQQMESIKDFLSRLPVAEPATASVGPWLWVSSPELPRNVKQKIEETEVKALIKGGENLLRAFDARRTNIELEYPNQAPSAITRKLREHRERLANDILSLAAQTNVTMGKWMLFPDVTNLPRCWRLVAEATASCKLGPTSKVATYEASQSRSLICIYTYNFQDYVDVRRVLEELIRLDLCSEEGKPIYYKCDAYTYLGIESGNSYKLRASLYSSTDVLSNKFAKHKNG